MQTTQRIPNLPSDEWTPQVEALFPLMTPPGSTLSGADFNSILVMAYHPELSHLWLRFNAGLARGFDLPPRLKEIAILRVAWRKNSQYEWVHHMLSGAHHGLGATHFAALQQEEPDADFSPQEMIVIRAADDFCQEGGLSDACWADLSGAMETKRIMELMFVIASYIALAAIFRSAAVMIEDQHVAAAKAANFPFLEMSGG